VKKKHLKLLASEEHYIYFAEHWFQLVGFVLITVAIHAAYELTGNNALWVAKWGCYCFLYAWLKAKFERLFIIIFPDSDMSKKAFLEKMPYFQVAFTYGVSVMIAVLFYGISLQIVEVLSSQQLG
jgi:hypothetical protein